MNTTTPQPRKLNPPLPPSSQASVNKVKFGTVSARKGHRVVLYGTGGIGKTSLACFIGGRSAIVDADESLSVLKGQLEAVGASVPVPVEADNFATLLSALRSSGWDGIDNIILDTATKIEEWCVAWTLKNVKHEKPNVKIESVEDYGYGKGYQHVYDSFLPLLAALDVHVRQGRNVILIAHECTSNVPNPKGEDWIRYEPRLQSPSSGKASIRHRIKEWADHVLFLGYDVESKDGVGQGHGTRSLYSSELPFCMAKSRTTSARIDIEHGKSPWAEIIK